MNDKLNGRTVFLACGRNAQENLCLLADRIAAVPGLDLMSDQDTGLVLIEKGKKIGILPDRLRELIATHIVKKCAIETNGIWAVTYEPIEVDEMDLRTMLTGSTAREDGNLICRCPPMPREPLGPYKERMAREKLQRGEPITQIARQLGTSVEMIKALGKQPLATADGYRYTSQR